MDQYSVEIEDKCWPGEGDEGRAAILASLPQHVRERFSGHQDEPCMTTKTNLILSEVLSNGN
jgi:hypothetical protein